MIPITIVVRNADLAANDDNFAVSPYVAAEDTREEVDIARTVSRQPELRTAIDEFVADLEGAGR